MRCVHVRQINAVIEPVLDWRSQHGARFSHEPRQYRVPIGRAQAVAQEEPGNHLGHDDPRFPDSQWATDQIERFRQFPEKRAGSERRPKCSVFVTQSG